MLYEIHPADGVQAISSPFGEVVPGVSVPGVSVPGVSVPGVSVPTGPGASVSS